MMRPVFRSTVKATLAAIVLCLGLPVLAVTASASSSDFTASAVDGPIPATLSGISLTHAPSFTGADNGIYELRSSVSTYLGVVQLDHTGAFYGRTGSDSDLCYVACSINGAEKAFSLTFTLPAGTTAFAVRLNPQEAGAATYTISSPDGATASFAYDGNFGTNGSARPTLAVSAANGSTLSTVTIEATQTDGCTYEDPMMGPKACYLYGLDIADVAIGNALVSTTTTTTVPIATLASTGSGLSKVLVVGLVLVAMGLLSVVASRRRTF